jgi:hypothetical protein
MERFIIAGIATLMLAASAQAAVIYSQTPTTNIATICSATSGCPNIYATQFTLTSAATADTVVWRGYAPNYGSVTDNFTISFYSDSSGSVGALLGSFSIGTGYTAVDTGLNVGADDIYEFTASLGSGMALPTGATWLTIYNNHTWAWQDADIGPYFSQASSSNGGATWFDAGAKNYYFSLENTVPIPAAVWLFGGALGALGWLKRKAAMA